MKHFLAYGNSDQASFREPYVLESFDYMTVPGTIASYYADATAGFVLTAEKPYLIDPRTPLLQGDISRAKASHLTLASWLGPSVEARVQSADGGPVLLAPEFFDEQVTGEMTEALVSRQRDYGQRAGTISKKLDRYRRLRADARGEPTPASTAIESAPPPEFVLAPYFASANESDPWWQATQRVWQSIPPQAGVSAVVAVTSPSFLSTALGEVPPSSAQAAFYWLTGFDERRASVETLEMVARAIETNSSRSWVNLYGGFYSICLDFVGLWGFNNGLGYSESRNWPELATTGAAPPRYYVPRLHSFLSPAAAQLVVDTESYFSCPCQICSRAEGRIVHLTYREFREHFALTRRWEIQSVEAGTPTGVAETLREADSRFRSDVAPRIPATLVPDLRHLTNWSTVLEGL